MLYYNPNTKEGQKYIESVNKETEILSPRNKKLTEEILEAFRISRQHNRLKTMLYTDETIDLTSIFTGDEFSVLTVLLGNKWAEKFKKVWDRCSLYPYSKGMTKRPFRMQPTEDIYFEYATEKLKNMMHLVMYNFSYEEYFSNSRRDTFMYNSVIADLIALEIDEGNDKILEAIDTIIKGENNAGVITRAIIKGMLMSHKHKVHKWAGDLLLAAKLQEGLRQTIVEVIDEGSKESLVFMLRLILDHDLIRFPSIAREFDAWTGLGIAVQTPSLIKKCMEAGYKSLTDNNYLEEALGSNDALTIYMALWALAIDDIRQAEEKMQKLFTSLDKYKKLVALYFLRQSELPLMQHRLAKSLLEDEDLEVKCWAIYNLFAEGGEGACYGSEGLFDQLKDILDGLPKKGVTFNESIFPWQKAELTCDKVVEKIIATINEDMLHDAAIADKHIDIMLDYIDKMGSDIRFDFISSFLEYPKTEKQKLTIIKLMGDKSPLIRSKAREIAIKLTLTEDDYQMIEGLLKYKSEDLRKNAVSLLLNQSPNGVLNTIRHLTQDQDKNKHLAVLDILSSIENKVEFKDIIEECRELVSYTFNTSQKTQEVSKKLILTQMPDYAPENGFGLCDPMKEFVLGKIECTKGFSYDDVICSSLEGIEKIFISFKNVFEQHKDFEYETAGFLGIPEKVTLGNDTLVTPIKETKNGSSGIDNYALSGLWKEEAKKINLTANKIIEILFYYQLLIDAQRRNTNSWFNEIMRPFVKVKMEDFKNLKERIPFFYQTVRILEILLEEFSKEERFWTALNISRSIYKAIPKDEFVKPYVKINRVNSFSMQNNISNYLIVKAYSINFVHEVMRNSIYDDKSFTEFFRTEYAYYQAVKYMKRIKLNLEDFERAFNLGLVDENELYLEMYSRPLSGENLYFMTDAMHNEGILRLNKLKEITKKVIERIAEVQVKQGDTKTQVGHLAAKIQRCEGVPIFVSIIIALEKQSYVRGYSFISGDNSKKQILSHLLKCCYPKEGEDEHSLKAFLKDIKLSEKQLIDAAMYAPQWLDIVEKYLGWEGLTMTGWYFHAHVNQIFSREKIAVVARFSPIEAEDFKNGACDIDWFHEAYNTLGKDRFNLVYDSAKYIAAGALHRRSQLFADAALGKLSCKEIEEVITSKRNKDYVLCYGLIPINNDKKEMLRRFEFLHRFIKESNQFGSLRRLSEQKAGSMGIYNLARNAGFWDIHRFTWYMETEKIHAIRGYLQPKAACDVMVHIDINDTGEARIKVTKEGKELKSIPKGLKKEGYIKELQEIKKSLKEQHIRARLSLEKAMEHEERFSVDELANLSLSPIIEPLLRNLIFIGDNKSGYFKEGTLVDYFGNKFKINEDEKLIIAHPVHLYKMGIWAGYQKDIFDKGTRQPFKQAFRELYRPNPDELENGKISYRYGGNQIQYKKTMALLKTRGWICDHYERFQKTYYKHNIAVYLILRADSFSLADIETSTIECVLFKGREKWDFLPFEDIPECIFSEVMRDIDLVVSIAHVGSVDPEASLSTVEMRKAVISEILRLLKLTNVTLKDAHALIKGKHGEYTVHLGSGIIHKLAAGAIHILAIHSGHRGKIFLPFMDEDPRTAEIISKIVFLAEDKKIKDPIILEQITR